MAPVGQVLGHGLFTKTKMCKFHQVGKCTKGMHCPWAHDASELKATPDLRRTKLCKELIATGHCTRPGCTFAHSKEDFRFISATADEAQNYPWLSEMTPPNVRPQRKNGAANKISRNPDPIENSILKIPSAGSASPEDLPNLLPAFFRTDAQEYPPMQFSAEEPAVVPVPTRTPWLEMNSGLDCPAYSLFTVSPSFYQEENASDFSYYSSGDDMKIDGNTPISQILALSLSPQQNTFERPSAASFASVTTVSSLTGL